MMSNENQQLQLPFERVRQRIGNFLFVLLALNIMLDPANCVLHLKDVCFVAFVGYNILAYKPDWKMLIPIGMVFTAFMVAYVFAEMQMMALNYDKVLAVAKSLAPLVALLWIRRYDVIRLTLLPACVLVLLMIVLYCIALSSEVLEYALFTYMSAHNDMIMMSHRSFLGFNIFGMYYKSFVTIMFAMFVFTYRFYNATTFWGRYGNLILVVLFTIAAFMSGTRSTMLLPLFMLGFVAYRHIARAKTSKYFVYPILVLFALLFLGLVFSLAMETSEASNTIKYAILGSYAKLFTMHPEYLLFGQGPSAVFFSDGMHKLQDETEWTYIELVRNYGLMSLLILAVVLYPIKRMWSHCKTDDFTFGIMGTYIAYLLIAGTNPLLLSSTGMIMILAAYSYSERLPKITPQTRL